MVRVVDEQLARSVGGEAGHDLRPVAVMALRLGNQHVVVPRNDVVSERDDLRKSPAVSRQQSALGAKYRFECSSIDDVELETRNLAEVVHDDCPAVWRRHHR